MVLVYSTDLTAAFDMSRPGLMINIINGRLPFKICRIMKDFLTERSFSVKVASDVSSSMNMDVSCAQGFTLGPKLFSMYCGGLSEVIKENFVAYADDAYVLISGNNVQELRYRAYATLKSHVDWLVSIGMVVNIAKTEAIVFHRGPENVLLELVVNDIKFSTAQSKHVLGVTFDARLRWDVQVSKVISQAKRTIQGLRILRRNMNQHIATAQFYSKMYYGSPVWLGHLSSKDLKRIESLHYCALPIGCLDFKCTVPLEVLDHDLKRATPSEWNDYNVLKEIILKSTSPSSLFKRLDAQAYRTNRPLNIRFFDKSSTKVRLQVISNKSARTMHRVNFDWYYEKISNDGLRIKLKDCFFKYPSSAEYSSVPGRVIKRHHRNRLARLRREIEELINSKQSIKEPDTHGINKSFNSSL
jgi:hypothetical protein